VITSSVGLIALSLISRKKADVNRDDESRSCDGSTIGECAAVVKSVAPGGN